MLRSAALCLLALAPIPVQDEELPDGNKLVQTTLLADREAVRPGGRLTLAVRLAIEPRWHVYWQNPGDSGIPTRATITAPEGWTVGRLQWPWPLRHDEEGDIVSFVHEKELVLLADVQVPATASPGTRARFEVEASWLVCTDICVPGAGKAALEVAVAAEEKPANAPVLAAARARLPKPWSELSKARLTWAGTEAEPRLTVVVPGAKALELFPLEHDPLKLLARTVDAGKNGATLKASFEFERETPEEVPRLQAVLFVRTEQGEASYALDATFRPPEDGR